MGLSPQSGCGGLGETGELSAAPWPPLLALEPNSCWHPAVTALPGPSPGYILCLPWGVGPGLPQDGACEQAALLPGEARGPVVLWLLTDPRASRA